MLTEPLRFRLGHPMDHSNAAGSSLVASLPEMRTAHALACPLMGYVCAGSWQCAVRSFSCEKLNLADFDERRSAFLHFAGAKRRRAQQKSGFAPLQILLGEHCRSHSLAELRWKGHWCSCTCSCSDAPSRASSCVSEVFCVSSSS